MSLTASLGASGRLWERTALLRERGRRSRPRCPLGCPAPLTACRHFEHFEAWGQRWGQQQQRGNKARAWEEGGTHTGQAVQWAMAMAGVPAWCLPAQVCRERCCCRAPQLARFRVIFVTGPALVCLPANLYSSVLGTHKWCDVFRVEVVKVNYKHVLLWPRWFWIYLCCY